MSLHHTYGVRTVYGFRYGYEGLTHRYGHEPVELTHVLVDRIHEQGGTILGSSRGSQDIGEMVDTLERMNIGILFTLGGDGTLHGASAFCLLLGQNAVHAGIAGRTNMVVGFWGNEFTHVPISMATSKRKKVDPEGWVWNSALTVTGQPREMK